MGAFRFCRRCGLDFEQVLAEQAPPVRTAPDALPASGWAAPKPAPAAAPTPSFPTATAAGVAWIAAAILIGYLALVQLGAAGQLGQLGLGSGNLQPTAIFNGISAAITLFFGARLLTRATRGFLGWSTFWAAINVGWGAYQVANGATHWAFIGSIVASGAAGILSFVAWSHPAASAAVTPRPSAPPAAEPLAGGVAASFTQRYAGTEFGNPATAANPTTATGAGDDSRRGMIGALLGALLLIAVVGAVMLGGAKSSTPQVAAANLPPAGEVWFGFSFDPNTFAMSQQATTFSTSAPIAAVIHLTHSMAGSQMSLRSYWNGTLVATTALTWSGTGDVWGTTLGPVLEAGDWRYEFVDVGGNVLASGQITVQ
ncbi:MAG: hypothetical protein ACYDCI_13570 [Candidatus Limnocylindrales bacterium]